MTFEKPKRPPEVMPAIRVRHKSAYGHVHATIVIDPKTGRELEVFSAVGKTGEGAHADLEAMCRLASLYMRAGGSLKDVAKQLTGIGTNLSSKDEVVSVPDALGRTLNYYLKMKEKYGIEKLMLGEVNDESEGTEGTQGPAQPGTNQAAP